MEWLKMLSSTGTIVVYQTNPCQYNCALLLVSSDVYQHRLPTLEMFVVDTTALYNNNKKSRKIHQQKTLILTLTFNPNPNLTIDFIKLKLKIKV